MPYGSREWNSLGSLTKKGDSPVHEADPSTKHTKKQAGTREILVEDGWTIIQG